ncbi:unnamed protein product [Calypogeia fissa]
MASDSAGFECYLRGSWWDVQIKEERSCMYHVEYRAAEDKDVWVPLTELRLSSRRADAWDCRTITKGMDVEVLAKHPHTISLNLEKEGLYDARVLSVARSIHATGQCSCKFSIRFFEVVMDTILDGTHGNLLDRILLTEESEIEVSISDIRILQKPAEYTPLRQVLDEHLDRRWIPFFRGCQDAYFLPETALSIVTPPRGALFQDDTDPTQVSPAEVLSPSPIRDSERNEERAWNCNTTLDDSQLDVRDCNESLGRAKEEFKAPKSASGAPASHEHMKEAGYADKTCPQTINVKRECLSARDDDDDRPSGINAEGPPAKKRGRPRLALLQNRKKNKRKPVDIEFTQLSSDTCDSETEWTPTAGVISSSNISRPLLRSATRSGTVSTRRRFV